MTPSYQSRQIARGAILSALIASMSAAEYPHIPVESAASPRAPALAALPDLHGFAGMFAGVSGGALLCAGGANFPDKPLSEGGVKVWQDRVFALVAPEGAWREVGRLPKPNGYGVAATWRDAVVLAGGGDAQANFRQACLMRWDGAQLSFEALPSLPVATANGCGTVVDDTLYVAGGQETPAATSTLKRCFALDLAAPPAQRQWREIPWPADAPGRILAVAGAHEDWFYLFSGTDLHPDASGRAERHYLTDAWRYRPANGWQRLADLPHAVAAAPSPAMSADGAHLVIAGGVSPEFLATVPANAPHPGFPRELLVYQVTTDKWISRPEPATVETHPVPSRVTASLVAWRNFFVVPSGEVAPGVRTPTVQAFRFSP